ncbi:hypothetical protein DJ568_01255 [Mucilaginibacter hurinus]|uniref:Mucoidy inhibitor MuiA family protein n=1 Tax=Mucilaginibacter hurinus TaxID=2201324 RepID=A0A367GTW3_9SPHI|nr:mucoidy inhibitor MuiA family protein [Mucilaginibacter hurinus]RCH56515.1 hypothetical protein DJ568_01255 [Mucilaginibacter hurinus]
MIRKFIFIIYAIFTTGYAHAYENQKIASKVEKVTVFLNGAQVTRTALVNISAGTTSLVFDGISPDIDVQSLQVRAAGDFTILSVNQELDFVNEQLRASRVQEIMNQRKVVQNKLDIQNSLSEIYQEEKNMMLKNQTITGDNSNLDLVRLRQALDFQTARLTELKKKQQLINEQIAALNIELQKYDKQIADVSRGDSKATSNVLVTVSSKAATQSRFTISYVVRNAAWYPTYDIRAKNVNAPVAIAYKANVSQRCGEEWKNVKLTLSTGNPALSGGKPSLNPNYLTLGMYYAAPAGSITRVTGTVADDTGAALPGVAVNVKGTSIGAVTDAAGRYSIQIPAGPQTLMFTYVGYQPQEQAANRERIDVKLNASVQSLNEVVVVGYGSGNKQRRADNAMLSADGEAIKGLATVPVQVQQQENQTNVEFNIENPYSVPSDGKQYTVEINTINIEAEYQYYTAPKLSTDVFLTATITDWNKYNFLSGEANVFFEGTYIGKSLIDTHNANDTLSLSLGTDKNIVVTRTLQRDMEEKKVFGSTKKETRDWLITIKNRKSQKISLLLEDQVPVSQNSAIEVETHETSGAKLDAVTGKLSWTFMLNSQQEKKVRVKYSVKYPKNQSVIVQ